MVDDFNKTIPEEAIPSFQDQRAHSRFQLWFPVTLIFGRKQVWAVCRDASAGGMLVASSAHVNTGAKVTVRFRVSPSETNDRTITGSVLRVHSDPEDEDGAWPHRIAISFDEPMPELAAVFHARVTEPPAGPDSSMPSR